MDPFRKYSAGDSHHSSGHGRITEKPYLQRIQSCTAEEEEDDTIDPAPDLLSPNLKSDLIVNTSATDINTTPQMPRRIYKSRLHRSVTISTGDAKCDEINVIQSHSPSPNPPPVTQFRTRGVPPPKTRWTSRIARMKTLQRSRTIDTRGGNTVQWNPGSLLVSPEINTKSSDAEMSEFQHLPESPEDFRSWSPKDTESHEHLLKRTSLTKKAQLEAGTQYHSPSSSVDTDQVSPIETMRKPKVSINFAPTADTELDAQVSAESQIPPNAAAMADGHVEELCDASKQSTSSYLKEQFFAFFQPSDNKLAMKLFGSKSALNKEKRRQQQHGKWIIHPCSSFR